MSAEYEQQPEGETPLSSVLVKRINMAVDESCMSSKRVSRWDEEVQAQVRNDVAEVFGRLGKLCDGRWKRLNIITDTVNNQASAVITIDHNLLNPVLDVYSVVPECAQNLPSVRRGIKTVVTTTLHLLQSNSPSYSGYLDMREKSFNGHTDINGNGGSTESHHLPAIDGTRS